MEIEKLINWLITGVLGLVGWFFKRELDKTAQRLENQAHLINLNENRIIAMEENMKGDRQLFRAQMEKIEAVLNRIDAKLEKYDDILRDKK